MNTSVREEEYPQPAMVGNPMLSQIRDFIDADDEPAALDPVGIVKRALRGRERRVAGMALLVALVAAVLAYLVVKPAYQSSGMVRAFGREVPILYSSRDDSRVKLFEEFVSAEAELLLSRVVLESALAELYAHQEHHAEIPFPLPGDIGDFASMFTVKSKKGLISVAARSSNPDLAAASINALLTAYQSGNESVRQKHYDVRREELSARAQELDRQLDEATAAYLSIGGEHDTRTLSRAHIEKTAQLEVLESRISGIGNTIAQLQATGGVGADVGSIEIQRATLLDQATADMTYERARRMAALETLRGRYRPSHPKLRAALGELAVLEGAIAERREQIATLGKAGALTDGGGSTARESVNDLENMRSNLMGRRQMLREEAAELNSKLFRIRRIDVEKERLEELLDETKQALEEVIVESQNDLSRAVEVIAFGKIPEGPIDDKRKPAALGAAVFATLGTLMLTIISTMLAGRLRFSDDMDARGESLLAAVVPDVEPPGEALAAAAVELRNEIDLRWPRQGTGAMVLGVVGASTGAGATSLAGALGMHYAGTGRRVILAEVDAASGAYRDAVQSDSPGVAAVARGDAALEDALQELPSEQGFLSLLPASPRGQAALRRSGVAELALDDMQNLLQSARAEADVIILDLGVLTAGRQSAVGAALSDRVLLVSSSGDRSSDLSGALDLLERLAPERALLAFNRASHLDPAIAASAAREPAVSFGAA